MEDRTAPVANLPKSWSHHCPQGPGRVTVNIQNPPNLSTLPAALGNLLISAMYLLLNRQLLLIMLFTAIVQHRYQKAFRRRLCVWSQIGWQLTTNVFVAMGSSFQKRSKIISNFWRCYTCLSLENLALQHPTETPPSFLSLQQWLQHEYYTRNRLLYTFHTHHPLGLSMPCDFCPVSASKLSKTRRSSACSSFQFESFDFKDTLTAYIYFIYTPVFLQLLVVNTISKEF